MPPGPGRPVPLSTQVLATVGAILAVSLIQRLLQAQLGRQGARPVAVLGGIGVYLAVKHLLDRSRLPPS